MGTVQFILGRSGTGKTRWCLDGICAALQTPSPLRGTPPSQGESLNEPLVLLVPEQATYQAERAILSHPEIAGFSRLHVLSFNRLQFQLNAGIGSAAAELSRAGKQMVLGKLLAEQDDQLSLYKGQAQRMGLASKLSDLLTDFQHSGCTAQQVAMLAESLAGKPGQALAAAKWADIAKIYAAYESFFHAEGSGFANPDIELAKAKDRVAAASFLHGARLWVDGFSGFSVQERDLLIELLKVCKDASIALCLDPATIDLDNDDEDKLDPCSLFASTEQTYCQLLRIVRGCMLDMSEPVVLTEARRFTDAPALAALEKNFISTDPPEPVASKGTIQIAACGNVRAETQWIAGRIQALVKDKGYRYRQLAVVVPDMDAYQHYLESAFAEYDLPYFLDRPRLMKTHPLTELIGSALQAVQNNFALSDVLSFLKSPLHNFDLEQIDALENYCRAHDVEGAEWLSQQPWDFASQQDAATRYDQPALDALRRNVVEPLRTLQGALGKKPITAADFTRAVWELLETLEVPAVLTEWAAVDVTDQEFGHRQVFSKMIALMNEMDAVFGDAVSEAPVWASIFTEAMASMTVKLIPPTLDQVLVGSIERSRHPDIRVIFLIGATQKQFPVPVVGETLLTEQDYQLAATAQLELANPYDVSLTHRPYLAYIALTRASKQVCLTYPLLDEKGGAVVPWSGMEQLTAMFKDIAIEYPPASVQSPDDIQNPHQLSRWLAGTLGKDRMSGSGQEAGGSSEEIAAGVFNRMADSGEDALRRTAEHVKQSLEYNNAAAMDATTANELFCFPMTTSVTRLGTFAKCPYQYFARYTLGLERRQLLRFEPMDVGTFYHDVLEAIFKTLKQQGADWADLSDDQLLAVCDTECDTVLAANTQLVNFTRRRAHHKYIIDAAKGMVRSFVPMLAQLSRAGRFKQAAAELAFGPKEKLRLIIPLDDQRKVEFKGFIDRLDVVNIDGKKAALVFDYKTGGKSVDFAGMLYGLDVQLPVYLLAIAGHGLTPVGAFFVPIDGGATSASLSDLDAIVKSFNKAKGLFDGRFFEAIDSQAAESGGRSEFYNFYVNKDGKPYSYYKTSGAMKPDDFKTLLNYTQTCIKKLVTDLAAGCIRIAPYRIGTTSPCTWCDYRALCRFDWQINDYNILESVNKEEALEKMKGV